MTYLILNGGNVEEANSKPLTERSRFLEMKAPGEPLSGAEMALSEPSPRMLKTHLQEHILGNAITKGKPKVIAVMRNPKDTLVSLYQWYKEVPDLAYPGTWNDFFEMYQKKELYYGDLIEFNCSWWKHRHDVNFLFLWFEDMKRNPRSIVRQIAHHCQINVTYERVERIVANSDFEAMKSSNAVKSAYEKHNIPMNDFLRQGKVGEWRNVFTANQNAYVDAQCVKLLDPVDLKFSYD